MEPCWGTASPAGQQSELEKRNLGLAVKGGTKFVEFELKKRESRWRESLLLRNTRFAEGQMRLEAGYKRILILTE